MDHPSHKLNAYCADFKKRTVYCELCGQEEGLSEPCTKKFAKSVDNIVIEPYPKFVSGLP